MAKCAINIELESSSARYTPGQVIRGVVTVAVDSDVKCNGLSVDLVWRTHGRGNRRSEIAMELTLFEGQWAAGQDISYPFEFTLPNGPMSYHGHYLNVDWYVRATADIPWAIDPKAEQEILLEPGPQFDPMTYIGGGDGGDDVFDKRRANDGIPSKVLLVFSLPFMLVGLGILAFGIFGSDADGRIGLLLFGLVIFLAGFMVCYSALRNTLAAKKLGAIRLAWPEQPIQRGESYPLTLHCNSLKNLNAVNMTLICRETVVSGSGTDRTTYTHEVFSAPIQMKQASDIGERLSMEASIVLPHDAAPSFYADDNELSWIIAVHIDVARWPDWKRELYLNVLPGVVGAERDAAPVVFADDTPALVEPARVEEAQKNNEWW